MKDTAIKRPACEGYPRASIQGCFQAVYARRDGNKIKLEIQDKDAKSLGVLELREARGSYSIVSFFTNTKNEVKGELIWGTRPQAGSTQAASASSVMGSPETPQGDHQRATTKSENNISPFMKKSSAGSEKALKQKTSDRIYRGVFLSDFKCIGPVKLHAVVPRFLEAIAKWERNED